MGWKTRGVFVAAVAGGAVAARRVAAARRPEPARWHAVTVYRPIDEVAPGGELPQPLRELGDGVEVVVRLAPGDRGTEIAARPQEGQDAGPVRRALREARSLLETGQVMRPDRPSTTRRTLLNRPMEHVTRHGREGGLL